MKRQPAAEPEVHEQQLLEAEREAFDRLCDLFAEVARPELLATVTRVAGVEPPKQWNRQTAKALPGLVDESGGRLAAMVPLMAGLLQGPVPLPNERFIDILAQNLARTAVGVWVECLHRGLKLARQVELNSLLLFGEELPHPLEQQFQALLLEPSAALAIMRHFASRLFERSSPVRLPNRMQFRVDKSTFLLERLS